MRTQCVARMPGAQLDNAKKPHLVKAIIEDGWGGEDGLLMVGTAPHWLTDDDDGIELAKSTTMGDAAGFLPIVYVSVGADGLPLDRKQIVALARDLSGVAHVVVEPSRKFSFRLRDAMAGGNVYGGMIGLALPKRGIVRKFRIGGRFSSAQELQSAVKGAALWLRGQMPSGGWDWSDLQENALRSGREDARDAQEWRELYESENRELKAQIRDLQMRVAEHEGSRELARDAADIGLGQLAERIGPELYEGELADRLRLAVREVLERSEQIGLDNRSCVIFERFLHTVTRSPGLEEFREDLRRATGDRKRFAADVEALLIRHGYQFKSDNGHPKLEPRESYGGLASITLSKTPSDANGLKNARSQIERAMGIPLLKS
ncbi:hypothetical protein QCN27_06250 [Cereibacter sp. SYSU M97828]|nr:hypothetical protein [Cereibacter flavus]